MKKAALLMQCAANGGVQRVMVNLARGLLAQGAEIDFLIADARGEMRALIPQECTVYDFAKRRYRGDLKVFLSLPQIARYMRKHPDTAILAAPGLSCTVAAFLKFFHRKARVVLIEDNRCSLLKRDGLYHKAVFLANRLFFRFADAVAAAHTPAMLDVLQCYGVKKERARVVYHPLIEPDAIRDAQPETEHPFVKPKADGYRLLLAAGRLVQEKAFDDLIDAAAMVRKEQKIKLLILGEGEQRALLQEKIAAHGMQADVELYGYTDRVYSFMKSADLFVLSSLKEAFGNVLVEAIACGLPCVATDCDSGGPKEIMETPGAGKFGVLCEKENVRALADAIRAALAQQYDSADFAEKAEQFTVDYAAKQYWEIVKGF